MSASSPTFRFSNSSARSSSAPSSSATPGAAGSPSGPTTAQPTPATPVPKPSPTRNHGPTTRSLLQIQWDYPIYHAPVTRSDGPQPDSKPLLSREEALRAIAKDDPRPLLVVRECPKCNRTDRALLTPGVDNEKTILLSRWFHCVKLAMDVAQPDHPFHALFPIDGAEHLFVSEADGTGRIPLESFTSRTDLWAAMTTTLTHAYSVDPTPAYKQLATLIDGFDLSDQRMIELQERRSRMLENGRPDAAALRKLDDDIEQLRGQMNRDLDRVARLPKAELASKATKNAAAAAAR